MIQKSHFPELLNIGSV